MSATASREWEPQVGSDAVELRHSGKVHEPDRAGEAVQVKRVTQTLVITSDGARYSRAYLRPVSEGRYSDRSLVAATDDRVLCVRGRELLAEVARTATNLAGVERSKPEDVAAALAQLAAAGRDAYARFGQAMAAASRERQESGR